MDFLDVEVKSYDHLTFPDECPTCGATPASVSITLKRSFSVPGPVPVSLTYKMDWPHCATCARFYTERPALENRLATHLLAVLTVSAAVLIWISVTWRFSIWLLSVSGALCTLAVIWQVWRFLGKYRAIKPSPTAVTKKHSVKLIRSGKDLISRKKLCHVQFVRPEYAIRFIQQNPEAKISFSKRQFRKVLTKKPDILKRSPFPADEAEEEKPTGELS